MAVVNTYNVNKTTTNGNVIAEKRPRNRRKRDRLGYAKGRRRRRQIFLDLILICLLLLSRGVVEVLGAELTDFSFTDIDQWGLSSGESYNSGTTPPDFDIRITTVPANPDLP